MSSLDLSGHLTIGDVVDVARAGRRVSLSKDALARIVKARALIEQLVRERKLVYGVTTGFGKFASVAISAEDTKRLQRNLIISHATGVGEPLPPDQARAVLLLRANALSRGHSGARPELIQTLIDMLNKDVLPVIPSKGSLGASGDLAPLAHMALTIIGEGEATYKGKRMPSSEAMSKAGIKPVELMEKEGLALINGTPVMTAIAALALYDAQILLKTADIAASMTLEAMNGISDAFDLRVSHTRPHTGQAVVAENIGRITKGSSMVVCGTSEKVQDPYSLRCAPQVHGASRDAFSHIWKTVSIEVNSVTDNPLVFPDDGDVISAGNFHGQPVALVMDYLKIAASELADISERRIEQMVNPSLSKLPAFLTEHGGLNSGLMITQYVAASLVSENKVLCHPASVDSIPTSANQEDHVSMGSIAARQAMEIIGNVRNVLAIELICAAQALDMRGCDGRMGKGTAAAYQVVRSAVGTLHEDRVMYKDLEKMVALVEDGTLADVVESVVGEL